MTPPHRSGAAERSSKPSGTRRATSAPTVTRSANPPSRSQPVNRAAWHRFSRPARHARHVPHVPASQPTAARSPGGPAVDAVADRLHAPHDLVARDRGQAAGCEVALDQLEVGATDCARADAKEQLARARIGVGDLAQPQRLSGGERPRMVQDEGAHQRTETLPIPPRTSISTRLAALAKSGDSQPLPSALRGKRTGSTSVEPRAIDDRIRAATPSGTRKRIAAAPPSASTRVKPAAAGRATRVSLAPVRSRSSVRRSPPRSRSASAAPDSTRRRRGTSPLTPIVQVYGARFRAQPDGGAGGASRARPGPPPRSTRTPPANVPSTSMPAAAAPIRRWPAPNVTITSASAAPSRGIASRSGSEPPSRPRRPRARPPSSVLRVVDDEVRAAPRARDEGPDEDDDADSDEGQGHRDAGQAPEPVAREVDDSLEEEEPDEEEDDADEEGAEPAPEIIAAPGQDAVDGEAGPTPPGATRAQAYAQVW